MARGTWDARIGRRARLGLWHRWGVLSVSAMATTAAAQESHAWSSERVARLFADLPATFEVTGPEPLARQTADPGFVRGWRYRVRSPGPDTPASGAPTVPSDRSPLRAWLEISRWEDADAAAGELERLRAAAEPETGLSYGWDVALVRRVHVFRLHAECTFSEPWLERLVERLVMDVAGSGESVATLRCRCGGGCGETHRVLSPRQVPAMLPEVPHPEGDLEEYDNRIDPSGRWDGEIGELALMHRANSLSFVYLAVFGEGAHVCEGAGVAGLTGTDRYEFVDDQGTVAFLVESRGVRVELVSGVASFCGAGWPGERFDIARFQAPLECLVTSPRARFHVVDNVDPEPRPFASARGARLEVVRAPGSTDEWLLARGQGETTSSVGLVRRADVSCSTGAVGDSARVR